MLLRKHSLVGVTCVTELPCATVQILVSAVDETSTYRSFLYPLAAGTVTHHRPRFPVRLKETKLVVQTNKSMQEGLEAAVFALWRRFKTALQDPPHTNYFTTDKHITFSVSAGNACFWLRFLENRWVGSLPAFRGPDIIEVLPEGLPSTDFTSGEHDEVVNHGGFGESAADQGPTVESSFVCRRSTVVAFFWQVRDVGKPMHALFVVFVK